MKEQGSKRPLKEKIQGDHIASSAAIERRADQMQAAGVVPTIGILAARDNDESVESYRESHAWLHALFEGVETGIFIIDAEKHRLIDANSVAADMVGVPRERILGNSCHKFVCPAEEGRCPVTDLGQTVDNSERILLTAAGERRLIIKTVRQVTVSGRTQLLESFLDITDRNRAQKELVLKTALLEAESETIDGILVVDQADHVLQSNRRFAEIFGFTQEAVKSREAKALLERVGSQFEDPTVFMAVLQSLHANELDTARNELRMNDGRCIDRYTSPLHGPSGKYYGRVCYFRDITEWKRAEQALRESERRYRELFENATEIIFTTDLEGKFVSLNRAGQRALGFTEAEAAQQAIGGIVTPADWESMKPEQALLLGGESRRSSEIEVLAKDGRRVKLEVRPRLVFDGGKPIGVQAIARDITGRDVAEMEIRQAQKLESVGRLASGIAHEINTPIQYIGDNARFLRDSFASLRKMLEDYSELRKAAESGAISNDLLLRVQQTEKESDCGFLIEEIPDAIAQTLEGVDRVATIVHAMKEFAHPEGKEMTPADLNKALLNTLAVARNELKYVAEIETHLGVLPMVVCNAGELNQVFLNLLVNSAHAVADVMQSGEKGRITVRTETQGDMVHVSIADTGAGIPQNIRDKVFDPFFTTKEVGRGTGQGLAIARSVIVERHKGTLTFESEVGKGTVFHIRLPVSPV